MTPPLIRFPDFSKDLQGTSSFQAPQTWRSPEHRWGKPSLESMETIRKPPKRWAEKGWTMVTSHYEKFSPIVFRSIWKWRYMNINESSYLNPCNDARLSNPRASWKLFQATCKNSPPKRWKRESPCVTYFGCTLWFHQTISNMAGKSPNWTEVWIR